jgi:hypothetical protein
MASDRKNVESKAAAGIKGVRKGKQAEAAPRTTSAAKPTPKVAAKSTAASYVLSAPKGPRTVSHRRIKAAVEKVVRERHVANG